MNILSDVITYVRRIVKSPSNAVLSDDLIIDYINRFWIMDVDARIQLFDLKTKYQFQTTPGWDRYNMPLYNIQVESGSQNIGMFPVYQGFISPAYINGIQVPIQTQKGSFFNVFPNVVQQQTVVALGNGTRGPYTLTLPISPSNQTPLNPPVNGLIRGHIDTKGIISSLQNVDPPIASNSSFPTVLQLYPTTSIDSAVFITATAADGTNIIAQDSGIFLEGNLNYGMLMTPGKAPFGNTPLTAVSGDNYSTTSNTVNYLTGVINVTFDQAIPVGTNINVQCFYFQSGLPRGILFYNNTITLRMPPAYQYLVELDAYLSPTAFLSTTDAIPFAYMSEYIARGAARKILSDTGDVEQFMFYEPLFKEQELLVWKRSQRQITNNRTETLYSQGFGGSFGNSNSTTGGGL